MTFRAIAASHAAGAHLFVYSMLHLLPRFVTYAGHDNAASFHSAIKPALIIREFAHLWGGVGHYEPLSAD